MWKKPEINKPNFEQSKINELNTEEILEVSGGSIGTCLGAGYTCNTSKGGIKVGTCLAIGYSCNTSKGGF